VQHVRTISKPTTVSNEHDTYWSYFKLKSP